MNAGGTSPTIACIARARQAPPPTGEEYLLALAANLAEELVRAWASGRRVATEDLLTRAPELASHPALLQVVAEEIRLRREMGPPPTLAEFQGRFPALAEKLAPLLNEPEFRGRPGPAPQFPECGDVLAECRLLAELGRGAEGRVFLATQPLLADRPVVLKLTPCNGAEHLSLARLLHTHIVPLYFVTDLPERHLRVLCMPYLGGATLAQVLEELEAIPTARRSGRDFLQALDRVQARALLPVSGLGSVRAFLTRSSYVEAVCWLGACLADALQFAHERDLVHLDIKPSNVLLAGNGLPLLLDFHLARPPLTAGSPPPPHFGGTNKYMPFEQRLALAAVGQNRALPAGVDGRADVYSLATLLCETLGADPESLTDEPAAELRRANPTVSPGLTAVLARCLADDPGQRYPDAASLAADLRNHLANRPLTGVPNRSWLERWQKWKKRTPNALGGLVLRSLAIAGVLGGLALGVASWAGQRHTGDAALAEGRSLLAAGKWADAERCLGRGLASVEHIPGLSSLATELAEARQQARQRRVRQNEEETATRLARDLHRLADDLRFSWDLDALTPEQQKALEGRCAQVWAERHLLGSQARTSESIRADLLDFAVLRAELQAHSDLNGQEGAKTNAIQTLREAENLLGASPLLEQTRRTLESAPTHPSQALSRPRTPWEFQVRGRELLRRGETEQALELFNRALQSDPADFWANFYQGVCAYRLRRFEAAVSAFRSCLALTHPASAVCYYNRALALASLDRCDDALADYDQALRGDPTLTAAWLNRGLLHFREKRLDQAARDLGQALALGADPAQVHYNLALVERAAGRKEKALEHARLALQHRPSSAATRELIARLEEEPAPPGSRQARPGQMRRTPLP